MKIFTVGIGSRSGELIPEYDEQGKVTGYVKDADGHYVTSRLAEDALGEIARKTGGEYFHADAKRFGVEDVERALSGLKRTENEARVVREYDEIFELLAAAGVPAAGRRGLHERAQAPKGRATGGRRVRRRRQRG